MVMLYCLEFDSSTPGLPTTMFIESTKQSTKAEVEDYFNNIGFDRWRRIYSDSKEINSVQRNIRAGHQKTVNQALGWICERGDLKQLSFCDAGCGVGSIALPLVQMGARFVSASDISKSMVTEARYRSEALDVDKERITFFTSDLENLTGCFDTVLCLDVLIHYPQEAAEVMVQHLCSLANETLIVSFAPYTPLLAMLKGIGKLFPGSSKSTRAYTLREKGIVLAALNCGFKQVRCSFNQAPFYFSRLIEFRRC